MRIAVDAMGGDAGPPVTVEGAVGAAREYGLEVTLVGDKATLERDREAAYQAVALDPLTAAVLTLDEARRMTDDLFAASAPLARLGVGRRG